MIIEQLRNLIILLILFVIGYFINTIFLKKDFVCSYENVDWDIAVTALSQHFIDLSKKNPNIDFGPADIKQHFAENCEEDTKIYNKYLANKK